MTASELAPDHWFRPILADYLGQLCAAVVLIASPQRIVVGGGVVGGGRQRGAFLHSVAEAMRGRLAGYVSAPGLASGNFIVPPAFEEAGLVGAHLIAERVARHER